MKSSVPPRFLHGIVPSALALLVLASPSAAQVGGVKSPSATGSSPAGGSQALGGGDPEILGDAGQFNVYSTRQLTIENAQVSGRIGAKKNFFISNAQIAYGDVSADVDSMASGRAVWAENGVLQNGNIVAELNLTHLENSFYSANSTLAPRIDDGAWDHEAMTAELYMNSATYGAMMPTGTATEDGFGNLNLVGSGANPEIFLITDNQLENASHVSVTTDPDVNVLINVEGGRVSPSNFGFEIQGTSANRVLLNMFEAWEIDFSQSNLSASLLAPDCVTHISNITVSGNIVGRWIELSNMNAQGDLLVGSIPSPSPLIFTQPMEELHDTLYHNLVVRPVTPGAQVNVGVAQQGGAIEVAFEGSTPHPFRSEKIAKVTFGGGILPEHVTLGPELDLPVHFLEEGPLGGNDLISLGREGADITSRGVIPLDVLRNDLAGTSGLDIHSIRIVNPPRFGVARAISNTGQIWYGWPDTKTWTHDRFQYQVLDNNGVASQTVEVQIVL